MSDAPKEGPERLKLVDFSFKELSNPKLREQILKSNKCGMMSQRIEDEAGTVEITLRDRRFSDAFESTQQFGVPFKRLKRAMYNFLQYRAPARVR